MPISALVLTMTLDDEQREAALVELERNPFNTLGNLVSNQLPLVIETSTVAEGIELVRDVIPSIPGVDFVHVISIDFSDMSSRDEKLQSRRKRISDPMR